MKKLTAQAILFDMDGVLVDSIDAWWKSFNHALTNYDKKTVTRQFFFENLWGHDLFDNLKTMKLSEEVGFYCNKIYSEHIDEIRIYDETVPTLEKLSNFPKCIITNTPKNSALAVVEKFNLSTYFDFVLTTDDVKHGKPFPDIILKACEKINLNPIDVIVIGDTQSDIKAAHAAGSKVIGMKIDADFRVENLSEIFNLIEI